MFLIPGFLISYLTFPGVMMHELGHQLACYISKVRVFRVKYFQFDLKTIGFVEHERTENPWKSLLITYGPFIFNTVLGVLFVLPLSMMWALNSTRFVLPIWAVVLIYVLAYIGISCLANAFPSSKDAGNLFNGVLKNKEVSLLAKIVIAPFMCIIYVCSLAKFFWFDFVFAFGVPELIYSLITHNPPHFWTMW